ncbi:N-acetylmuramoyl-L-alanine amidase [invertebrate metagenome]|uniref:N-acetylmuramoyl-L-alanine amidase n=1 Tax=invertebrate metagenome TaxID=1711999 RepID=A0A484H7Q7_9ZZZZ
MFVTVALWIMMSLAHALGEQAFAAEVTAVRMGNHRDHTRFVVDLSENLSFSVSPTSQPDRVIVEIGAVAWRMPPVSGGGTGVVRRYRYNDVAAQIVLELVRPAVITKAFMLSPDKNHGWRLVIDVTEATLEAVAHDQHLHRESRMPTVAHLLNNDDSLSQQALQVSVSSAQLSSSQPPAMTSVSPLMSSQRVAVPMPPLPPVSLQKERRPMIVLDPGHGGADPGATGFSGIFEKHITLAMALELREKLLGTNRYRVMLTREDDTFIALRERVASARAHNADLFISIHADAIATPEICGLSVYTLSEEASDQEAAALAERENRADLIGGIDLSRESRDVANILIDLVQRETMNHSAQLASAFTRELRREIRLLPKTHRFAGFAVLKAPDVPAILLEMGYLSNPKEEQLLHQPAYRAKLSSAMVRAVDDYFKRRKISLL